MYTTYLCGDWKANCKSSGLLCSDERLRPCLIPTEFPLAEPFCLRSKEKTHTTRVCIPTENSLGWCARGGGVCRSLSHLRLNRCMMPSDVQPSALNSGNKLFSGAQVRLFRCYLAMPKENPFDGVFRSLSGVAAQRKGPISLPL